MIALVGARENEQSVRRYWDEFWSKGNLGAAADFYAPTYSENGVELAPEEFANGAKSWLDKFEDFSAEVQKLLSCGDDARRPSRCSARRGYGIRAPSTEREPGTASSAAPSPAQHQVSAARWIASRKLPNRRRIVFSEGRIAASVQLSAVGSEPCSATNSRRAATDSSIRVSATSDSGTASPSNTPGGFVLWELRSTIFRPPLMSRLNAKTTLLD